MKSLVRLCLFKHFDISHLLFVVNNLSGLVFTELDEAGLKEFGFVKAGFYVLRGVMKQVFRIVISCGQNFAI